MHRSKVKYRYLFGPVPSRRLGRSLGVDLTPYKTCSQNCVFCQLGRTARTTIARQEYVPIVEVLDELGEWLKRNEGADHITLSGSGEPTLHAAFGEVPRLVRKNSSIRSVLLTNGSLFHLPEVRSGASQADIVKISLSAWDQDSYGWVNRPHPGLHFKEIIDGMKAFRDGYKGELWIEVFLVAGMNSIPSDASKIAALADVLRPDRIHLNTACRPPAENFVAPLPKERMASLCRLFHPPAECIADYEASEGPKVRASQEEIFSMLKRRPCTAEEIAGVFSMHLNEVSKYLGRLLREGRIRSERNRRSLYYSADINEERRGALPWQKAKQP